MRDKNIRHIPVVSGPGYQRLVGMITDRDIREAAPSPATTLTRGEIAYQLEKTAVKMCMTQEVVCIGPEAEMVQATRLLVQRRIGCLPVVDRATLVGVVTAMDCLRACRRQAAHNMGRHGDGRPSQRCPDLDASFPGRSWCRCALYTHVCHAADGFSRRASLYACLGGVPMVIATRSSKAARPKLGNALSANTAAAPLIAFSWISSTKAVPLRSQSSAWP